MAEQTAAATIFNTCCNDTNSCVAWKAANKANNVAVYSDLCHLSGQICDSDGAQLVLSDDKTRFSTIFFYDCDTM